MSFDFAASFLLLLFPTHFFPLSRINFAIISISSHWKLSLPFLGSSNTSSASPVLPRALYHYSSSTCVFWEMWITVHSLTVPLFWTHSFPGFAYKCLWIETVSLNISHFRLVLVRYLLGLLHPPYFATSTASVKAFSCPFLITWAIHCCLRENTWLHVQSCCLSRFLFRVADLLVSKMYPLHYLQPVSFISYVFIHIMHVQLEGNISSWNFYAVFIPVTSRTFL